MKKTTIIFDFDGTFADTLKAALKIYNRIAAKYKLPKISQDELTQLQSRRPQAILKTYGVNAFKFYFLSRRIRKELHQEISQIKAIKGMPQVLKALKKAGYNLGVISSNSEENIQLFLSKHGLEQIFDFISSAPKLFGKDQAIKKILKKGKIPKGKAFYVGDETRDIEAAQKVGLQMVAVSWGFNTKTLLKSLKPTKIVDTPKELLAYLQKF